MLKRRPQFAEKRLPLRPSRLGRARLECQAPAPRNLVAQQRKTRSCLPDCRRSFLKIEHHRHCLRAVSLTSAECQHFVIVSNSRQETRKMTSALYLSITRASG
jgi:hypothetical protein